MLTRLRVAWAQGGAANAAKQRMAQSFTKHGVVPVTSPAAPAFAAPTLSLSPAVNSPALALGASMLTAHHFDDAVRSKPPLCSCLARQVSCPVQIPQQVVWFVAVQENTPAVSCGTFGASPVSTQRKGRVSSSARRRRALSSRSQNTLRG